jgi:tyrosine aminotransferase
MDVMEAQHKRRADAHDGDALVQKSEFKEKRGKVDGWKIGRSVIAQRTVNPIRQVVDTIKEPEGKDIIRLNLGDPSRFGNMPVPAFITEAVIECIKKHEHDGYGPSTGLKSAAGALAKRYSTPSYPLTEKDVILTCGGSGAIVIALQALANPGDNVLIPRPGFAFYKTAAMHSGISIRFYNLLPDQDWEADLEHMASLVDDRTRAIVVNNPSNPCGANYSQEHLLAIIALAESKHLPIISDEIYANLVFPGETFYSLPQLSDEVPMLLLGGMAKQFFAPGWRMGWIVVHNRQGRFNGLYESLQSLSQLMLGPTTFIQSALPKALAAIPDDFFEKTMVALSQQAKVFVDRLSGVDGLQVVPARATIYLMIRVELSKFQDLKSVEDFTQKLLDEEFVYVLPGSCFAAPEYFRLVFCAPEAKLQEACDRIERFCIRHRRAPKEAEA